MSKTINVILLIGMIVGVVFLILGNRHQQEIKAEYDRLANPVSYTHLTLPTNREV